MNAKTTLVLLILLVLGGGLYYVVRQKNAIEAAKEPVAPPNRDAAATTRDLVNAKPGDAVKITVKRKNQPEWSFAKEEKSDLASPPAWRMTAPLQMSVTGYEVDRIGRQITGLQYDVSYKSGDPGTVTAAEAGLDPAELVITVVDAAGNSATVEIGRPRTESETYVRLPNSDTIVVAKSNLKNLVKPTAIEYRDLQLWNFAAEKATHVEIDDRTQADKPIRYSFVKEGGKWLMQSPVTARATGKVDEMLRTMNRLRSNKWEDDRRERLAIFGLAPAAWSIRATVVEDVPSVQPNPEDENAEEKPDPQPESKTTVYELHLSSQSPIGDDAKAYIRTGDDSFVGTIAKVNSDKFKPAMADWRDMHVTSANVNDATRIELLVQGSQATLTKALGRWKFDPEGTPAEDAAVKSLLKAIADLSAVSFAEGKPTDAAALDMVNPQAEIRLTIPGAEEVERITVGGNTDAMARPLVYVRRNEVASVAKVRASEVAPLTQHPRHYRDRAILDIHADRFETITLQTRDGETATPILATFERIEGQWSMTAPLAATARSDRLDQLVTALGALRAESTAAEGSESSAFGLDAPSARITFTYKPPVQYRVEPQSPGEQNEGEAAPAESKPMVSKEFQPPSETIEIAFAQYDGKFYAKRADRPAVYQVNSDVYQKLMLEYRAGDGLAFEDAKVRRFTLRSGDAIDTFERKDGKWVYTLEPDLPLDTAKVNNLLLQIKDLKTERFVEHAAKDLAAYGLVPPAQQADVSMEDGTELSLLVSSRSPEKGTDRGLYAAVKGRPGVFLLAPDAAKRLQVVLQDLEAGKKP